MPPEIHHKKKKAKNVISDHKKTIQAIIEDQPTSEIKLKFTRTNENLSVESHQRSLGSKQRSVS